MPRSVFFGAGFIGSLLLIFLLLALYFLAEETEAKFDENVVLGGLIVFSLWTGYCYLTRFLRWYLHEHAFKDENVQNFLILWRYVWMGMGLIFVVVSFSGSIAARRDCSRASKAVLPRRDGVIGQLFAEGSSSGRKGMNCEEFLIRMRSMADPRVAEALVLRENRKGTLGGISSLGRRAQGSRKIKPRGKVGLPPKLPGSASSDPRGSRGTRVRSGIIGGTGQLFACPEGAWNHGGA